VTLQITLISFQNSGCQTKERKKELCWETFLLLFFDPRVHGLGLGLTLLRQRQLSTLLT
jgi:hypothetical protein